MDNIEIRNNIGYMTQNEDRLNDTVSVREIKHMCLEHIVTVCVFVCHVFSYHPFYFEFHSARIIFDVSSGFYLWNVNRTTT